MSLFHALGRHLESGALDELTLTTNGSQLGRFARELADCGVTRVNVSVDTLNPEKFHSITRRGDLPKVLAGIDAALDAGLEVKINAVALRGINEDELSDMVAWCGEKDLDLTLIETMPLGRDRGGPDRPVPALVPRPRPARPGLDARRYRLSHRRSGALCPDQGNRQAARLHHAAQPQFLRILQPRAPHLHRHALHVPRPGRFRRPPPSAASPPRRRGPGRRARRGDRTQAQGPRLRHRPATTPSPPSSAI